MVLPTEPTEYDEHGNQNNYFYTAAKVDDIQPVSPVVPPVANPPTVTNPPAIDTSVASTKPGPPTGVSTTVASDLQSVGASVMVNDSQQPIWGLTISGYYYIALNRLSGHIEGLYYDVGSAPFQSLTLSPLHTSMLKDTEEKEHAFLDLGGLRTNFSLVEFR